LIEFGSPCVPGRIWDRITTDGEHWVWDGVFTDQGGWRGQTTLNGHPYPVAAVLLHLLRGKSLTGLRADPVCGEERCVHPDHVSSRYARFAVTCPNGHPWSPETTTYLRPGNRKKDRRCLVCVAEARERRLRAREGDRR
jgi:hypothetical protein